MYEDDRPSLRAELNAKFKKDMNETFGRSKLTRYHDRNGRRVAVGDCIEFLFWVDGCDGNQHERYYYGRIVKRRGKLCFRYKPDGVHWSERRLDALNFDPETDWEIYFSPTWKLIK